MKRIGIISDTHGYWDERYATYLEPCDEIWHAGDIGTTELADRLAEATAERLHKEVRQTYWGYARHEHLPMDELHTEQFEGIRPAVGYPSLPDASLNFLLDELLHLQQIGIHLTESGAMKPHASVSGLMLAHPQSRYFAVGKIDERQLTDYARRRNLPVDTMRRFLAANL